MKWGRIALTTDSKVIVIWLLLSIRALQRFKSQATSNDGSEYECFIVIAEMNLESIQWQIQEDHIVVEK